MLPIKRISTANKHPPKQPSFPNLIKQKHFEGNYNKLVRTINPNPKLKLHFFKPKSQSDMIPCIPVHKQQSRNRYNINSKLPFKPLISADEIEKLLGDFSLQSEQTQHFYYPLNKTNNEFLSTYHGFLNKHTHSLSNDVNTNNNNITNIISNPNMKSTLTNNGNLFKVNPLLLPNKDDIKQYYIRYPKLIKKRLNDKANNYLIKLKHNVYDKLSGNNNANADNDGNDNLSLMNNSYECNDINIKYIKDEPQYKTKRYIKSTKSMLNQLKHRSQLFEEYNNTHNKINAVRKRNHKINRSISTTTLPQRVQQETNTTKEDTVFTPRNGYKKIMMSTTDVISKSRRKEVDDVKKQVRFNSIGKDYHYKRNSIKTKTNENANAYKEEESCVTCNGDESVDKVYHKIMHAQRINHPSISKMINEYFQVRKIKVNKGVSKFDVYNVFMIAKAKNENFNYVKMKRFLMKDVMSSQTKRNVTKIGELGDAINNGDIDYCKMLISKQVKE